MADQPSPNGANGRLKDGRFAPGWKGGTGNPNAKRTAEYRAAIREAVGPEHVKQVILAMVRDAQSGEKGASAAAKIVLEYTVGKPKDEIELSGAVATFKAILKDAAEEV